MLIRLVPPRIRNCWANYKPQLTASSLVSATQKQCGEPVSASDRMRDEMRARMGEVEVAVDLIREIRDEG